MAYTTATMNLIISGQGGAPSIWSYTNTDAHTVVAGAGYFSDGANKGLKKDDIVFVVDTDSATGTMHTAASTTAVNAATLA